MLTYAVHADDRPVSFTVEGGSPTQRVEPITLAQAKAHLRLTGTTSQDALIEAWVAAARSHFEEQSGRASVNGVWEYGLDGTPLQRAIELPRPPMWNDVTVTYDDAAGAEQTFDAASYRVLPSFVVSAGSPSDTPVIDAYCPCGRIELVSGATWPTTSGLARSLRIRRTCGYGETADAMPKLLQAVLFLLVGHFYAHREEVTEAALHQLPLGVEALLRTFKWSALPHIALTTYTPRPIA